MVFEFMKPPYRNQYFSVLILNFMSFVHGSCFAWMSPAALILKSPDTPLQNGPLHPEQVSLLGASIGIGGVLGLIISQIEFSKFGYRPTLISIGFYHIIWWGCVAFSSEYWVIVVGRIILGATGGALFKMIPCFIFDTAQKENHPVLGLFFTTAFNIGLLLGYVLGTFVPFRFVSISFVLAVIYMVWFFICVPEPPAFLLRQGKTEEAYLSLLHYRTHNPLNRNVPQYIVEEFEQMKKVNATKTASPDSFWSILFKKENRTGIIKSIFIVSSVQLCGYFIIQSYAATIFVEAGSSILPNYASMIVAVMQICGNLTSFTLIRFFAPKIILLISSCIAAILYAIFGAYSYINTHSIDLKFLNWLPIVVLCLIIFTISVGISPIPPAIVTALLRPEAIQVGVAIANIFGFMFTFIMLFVFPIMMAYLHVDYTMWIFAILCFLIFVLVGLFIPNVGRKK